MKHFCAFKIALQCCAVKFLGRPTKGVPVESHKNGVREERGVTIMLLVSLRSRDSAKSGEQRLLYRSLVHNNGSRLVKFLNQGVHRYRVYSSSDFEFVDVHFFRIEHGKIFMSPV